jgi:hypothetical protein
VVIARQWHGKHISTAMNQHTTIEELWEAVFSVSQSARLLLGLISTVIPVFSLRDIHDQEFGSVLHMYMFRNWIFSLMREGEESIFLRRHHVGCTVVSARIYPRRYHGIHITMDSVHPLSLHYTK